MFVVFFLFFLGVFNGGGCGMFCGLFDGYELMDYGELFFLNV